MRHPFQLYVNTVVPLVIAGVENRDIGYLEASAPAFQGEDDRFLVDVGGNIRGIIELNPVRHEYQSFRWALWPRFFDVPIPGPMDENTWPGEAWGTGTLHRQSFKLRLMDHGRFHCRSQRRAALRALPHTSLDDVTSAVPFAA